MPFLPKNQGPVSTITKLLPTSFVASSTLPMSPSIASTLKPVRSMVGGVSIVYVHISTVAIYCTPSLVSFLFAYPETSTPNNKQISLFAGFLALGSVPLGGGAPIAEPDRDADRDRQHDDQRKNGERDCKA